MALPEDPPVAEHSWFDGFAWEIVYCVCGQHLGWRFTATSGGNAPLFFGVRRAAIASEEATPAGTLDFGLTSSDEEAALE
jgi:hypothetical protein